MNDATRSVPPIREPEPLAHYLARGGTFAQGTRAAIFLAELAVCELELSTAEELDHQAHAYRRDLADLLTGETRRYADLTPDDWQDVANMDRWCADLIDAPDLVPRVLVALPAKHTDDELENLRYRLHPFPLDVVTPSDRWRCCSCGDAHDGGTARAVTLTDAEGVTFDFPVGFCAPCITIAAALVNGTDLTEREG